MTDCVRRGIAVAECRVQKAECRRQKAEGGHGTKQQGNKGEGDRLVRLVRGGGKH